MCLTLLVVVVVVDVDLEVEGVVCLVVLTFFDPQFGKRAFLEVSFIVDLWFMVVGIGVEEGCVAFIVCTFDVKSRAC